MTILLVQISSLPVFRESYKMSDGWDQKFEIWRNMRENLHSVKTFSNCQTACPFSERFASCQNTVWHKKKALPNLTTLALCLVTASLCQFEPVSQLRREGHSLPMNVWQANQETSPTELQSVLSRSMQSWSWQRNHTKMRFIKA